MPENTSGRVGQELVAIGELLRAERQRRGISLEQAQEETKIRRRYLEALEGGDPKVFPGEVYLKGFMKNYAQFLGLPGEEIVARYVRACADVPKEEKAPRKKPPGGVPVAQPRHPGGLLTLAVLAVLLAAAAIFFVARGPAVRTSPPRPGAGTEASPPPAAPEGTAAPAPEAPAVEGTPENQVHLVQDLPKEALYQVRGNELTVELKVVGERCWVAVRTDGGAEQARTLVRGAKESLTARDKIWLRAGDPGALELTINGVNLGPAGVPGRPRNISIERLP